MPCRLYFSLQSIQILQQTAALLIADNHAISNEKRDTLATSSKQLTNQYGMQPHFQENKLVLGIKLFVSVVEQDIIQNSWTIFTSTR